MMDSAKLMLFRDECEIIHDSRLDEMLIEDARRYPFTHSYRRGYVQTQVVPTKADHQNKLTGLSSLSYHVYFHKATSPLTFFRLEPTNSFLPD
jgi:hypothetical protein